MLVNCTACRSKVEVIKLGVHLRDFCVFRTPESRQEGVDKFNKIYPHIKSCERGEITLDELQAIVNNLFGPVH